MKTHVAVSLCEVTIKSDDLASFALRIELGSPLWITRKDQVINIHVKMC